MIRQPYQGIVKCYGVFLGSYSYTKNIEIALALHSFVELWKCSAIDLMWEISKDVMI